MELASVQSGHKERITLLEDRIGNLIPKLANNKGGIPSNMKMSSSVSQEAFDRAEKRVKELEV